jgi:hypothetical protein
MNVRGGRNFAMKVPTTLGLANPADVVHLVARTDGE